MTTPPEEITVLYPKCGEEYRDWIRRSVNADLDPEIAADEEYLREASSVTCPRCAHRIEIGTLIANLHGDFAYFPEQ